MASYLIWPMLRADKYPLMRMLQVLGLVLLCFTAAANAQREPAVYAALAQQTAPAMPAVPSPPTIPKTGFLVVIDAAHGGGDASFPIGDKLAEKDVTLGFARRLSRELEGRGIAVRMLRNYDAAISDDQRAVMANAAEPSLYISIHACSSGSGVHTFTAQVAPAASGSAFLPWNTAQAGYVRTSRSIAEAITTELLKRDIPAIALRAAVPPLNSIAAPAVALELAPPSGQPANQVNAEAYQQGIAAAVSVVIASKRFALPRAGAAR